jgi:hypothetical protein
VAGGDTRLIGAILLISEKLAKLEFEPEPKQVALELEQILVFGQELPFVLARSNEVVGLFCIVGNRLRRIGRKLRPEIFHRVLANKAWRAKAG